MIRVVLTGGATGGHTTPLLPVVEVLRRRPEKRFEFIFMGVITPHIRELLGSYSIPMRHIPAGKIRRYWSLATLVDLLVRLPVGMIAALWCLWRFMPDVVVSKGGYGSVPVVLAAWFYRIPIMLHESDAVPGVANARLARLARVIAVGFEETRSLFGVHRYKTVVTGTPIRLDFGAVDQAAAKQFFGLAPADLLVLIVGGSQGAQQINEATLKILPQLVTEVAIIHLTGPDHYQTVSAVAKQLLAQSAYRDRYQALPALTHQMGMAMSAADVIVSRAGASTLAEIAHLGKASLLIPLPNAAQDNQRRNAAVFERHGAAFVLDAANLGPHLFHRTLEQLIQSPGVREELGRACAKLDRSRAAQDMAAMVVKLAGGLGLAQTA